MGFRVRKKDYSEGYEVGITNMYGMFRLEDFWSPYGGATKEECEEYIRRIKAASLEIERDILGKRKR